MRGAQHFALDLFAQLMLDDLRHIDDALGARRRHGGRGGVRFARRLRGLHRRFLRRLARDVSLILSLLDQRVGLRLFDHLVLTMRLIRLMTTSGETG